MLRIFLTLAFIHVSFSGKSQSVLDTLTYQEKVRGISTFWKEAAYNFVFFDKIAVDWDSAYCAYLPRAIAAKNVLEYYQVLSDFATLLKDGHTGIFTPDYFWKEIGPPPLQLRRVGSKYFVSRIDERLVDEIAVGTEVIRINNEMPSDFLARRNSLNGLKGTELTFTFQDNLKQSYSKTLKRVAGKEQVNYLPPLTWVPFQHKQLNQTMYYVRINTFADSTVVARFRDILPQIQQAKYLILDVRENGGGNSMYARKIAEHLVDRDYVVGSAWRARVHNSVKKAYGSFAAAGYKSKETIENKDYFFNTNWEFHPGDTTRISNEVTKVKIPILVLIGPRTFSAAEDFLIYLDGSKHIQTLGQSTAGSSGQPLLLKLPKGLSARICSKRDTYPDGREFINIGIKPDIFVEKRAEDYLSGIDSELQAAINHLIDQRR
ncbi:S41 family peptidase [Spirosoma montaniterrae]|uniref:Tail specific protease domain-containing protein n=1 Tax=Spirosoma montaniterrae TaxID=1178516 RepID=A0A1P9WXF6_9BACT|nr:S41 family peptidase [Spirosoma montaniterrae]AQG80049.1 hypothetical protein AWR27_12375 [Spirosoma montaniterrae]